MMIWNNERLLSIIVLSSESNTVISSQFIFYNMQRVSSQYQFTFTIILRAYFYSNIVAEGLRLVVDTFLYLIFEIMHAMVINFVFTLLLLLLISRGN